MSDDRALHDWIVTLEEVGVSLVTETPPRNGQLLRLADRVAFLRKTNYGCGFVLLFWRWGGRRAEVVSREKTCFLYSE